MRDAAHVVVFLADVKFKIAPFQLFAQFTQGKVEIECAANVGKNLFGVELIEQAGNGNVADLVLFAVQYQAVYYVFQLFKITRPIVLAQAVHRARGKFDGAVGSDFVE